MAYNNLNLSVDPFKKTQPIGTKGGLLGMGANTALSALSGINTNLSYGVQQPQVIGGIIKQPTPQTLNGQSISQQGLDIAPQYKPIVPIKTTTRNTNPTITTQPQITTQPISTGNPIGTLQEQMMAGNIYNTLTGEKINYGTQTSPAPQGSVASLGDYNPSGYSSSEQASLDAYEQSQRDAMMATFDPNTIYKQNLQMYQAQIDALNNIYNDQLNRSRIENAPDFQSKIGSQTAMAARGGLLGSDPGKAMIDQQQRANERVQASQDAVFAAQRNDAIARIYGQVADSVTAAKKSFEETKKKSAEDYIAGIKARPEERKKQLSSTVKALIAQLGYDSPNEFSAEEIKKFTDKIGVSPSDFASEYETQIQEKTAELNKQDLATRKTEADIAQTEAETGQIGKITPYQAAQLGIEREKLAIDKAKKEKDFVTYDEKTIPKQIKTELISDLQSNLNAKRKDKKELNDFISAYPEIDSTYLVKLFEATK